MLDIEVVAFSTALIEPVAARKAQQPSEALNAWLIRDVLTAIVTVTPHTLRHS